MELADFFPMWNKLSESQRGRISAAAVKRSVKKGALLHDGGRDCAGLMLVCAGQLRAYMLSDEGREISLYRLFELDICLLSASCVMPSISFEVNIAAEKDSELWVIPPWLFRELMEESAPFANFVNGIMASRFSEVMWLVEQIMWKSFDKRLAEFLLSEVIIENSTVLNLTHELIGNHLGTAREVVTRMLRYFQSEGMVRLARGSVEVRDAKKLERLRDG